MTELKLEKVFKELLFFHLVMAALVGIVLAMRVHLFMIDAKADVTGAGTFLLLYWIGFPFIVLFIGITRYTRKVATDRRAKILIANLTVILFCWIIGIGSPSILFMLFEASYILLAVVFFIKASFGKDWEPDQSA